MGLKQFKLHAVRAYISVGLFFYYKQIHVKGAEFVPKAKPVLILSNHQNALLDPLLIATQSKRFCYYLTRAAVFQKPFISKLLKGLNMLPVYRVRDGWQTITNNNAVFETCKGLLKNNEALVIFPEGSHNLNRKVRPLSKGFTRIILDTLEVYPDLDLQLLPVGVNYISPEDYADSMLLNIGKPISAQRYRHLEKTEAVIALKRDIQNEIQLLTTHIADNHDEVVSTLVNEEADFLNPDAINHYLEHDEKVSDFEVKRSVFEPLGTGFRFLLKLVLLPVYALWKLVLQPKIKEKEFTGTFRFAVGLTAVPLWLLIVLLIIGMNLGWPIALGSVLVVCVIALVAVKL
ncbi:1-acyl-sn-glycerol-3-phosphate acyltransferase [Formosa agariphila KMM 3901]|uniref:1-acyl-sn-glycerol-3-phosphate acyltransferase n=1 Tax=Formosa agariphila (strain DSM 15362 / KCTC 12365 / LMG 23005 / KMM 3901 / M-2Alg 35-1) TaxID=1347342 RepID=T2KJ45_FORAG|nr:lysophospholipid acyltransferase family protein [Formosa agariphila]CDF78800.1 1-acyl-sn-glycerol-3-phosphate acyltransferase [Formosa agariphila KMM 3901]